MNQPAVSRERLPSHVWVVMFDAIQRPLTFDDVVDSEQVSEQPLRFNAFDDLDSGSDYFEQFVAQDVRHDVSDVERLGGAKAFQALFKSIRQAGPVAAVHLKIAGSEISFDASGHSISGMIEEAGGFHTDVEIDGLDDGSSALNDAQKSFLHTASLVWISVSSAIEDAEDSFGVQEQVLRTIQSLRQELCADKPPMLIVTGLRGIAKPLSAPLECSLDENEIHLPLWIDHGAQHPGRIQSLAGSQDLLPTIADALGAVLPLESEGASDVGKPMSLLRHSKRLAGSTAADSTSSASSPEPMNDRILTIVGDNWTALRAQQYLLVRRTANAGEDETGEPELVRQMFLKPDDAWNVNDMIVPYEAVADEMEARALGS